MMIRLAARLLAADERDAVLGDLAESGESDVHALRGVLGLVVRRHLSLGLLIPLAAVLSFISRRMADHGAIFVWLYANNWDPALLSNAGYRHDLAVNIGAAAEACLALFCLASICGCAIGLVSRARGALFTMLLLSAFGLLNVSTHTGRSTRLNAPVFDLPFYRTVFPLLVQATLVAAPTIWGMRRSAAVRRWLFSPLLLLVTMAGAATAADPPAVRAAIQPDADRKPAPEVALKDSSGKQLNLKKYRRKVVLLDFWATWCTGCKTEIPWFAEFQRTYGRKGLSVVGVAMDDEGWKIVKPFLAGHNVPYRTVVGNEMTMKGFGLQTLPDTFLIDRRGRLAAAYRAGLVDRENIESNIKALLADKR